MTVKEAKEFLKLKGYYVGNLWSVADVQHKFKCTDEEAQHILDLSLNNEATMEQVWFSIGEFGEIENLEEVED